jgi:hypothetical protein
MIGLRFLNHSLVSSIAKRVALIREIVVVTKILFPEVIYSGIVMEIFKP